MEVKEKYIPVRCASEKVTEVRTAEIRQRRTYVEVALDYDYDHKEVDHMGVMREKTTTVQYTVAIPREGIVIGKTTMIRVLDDGKEENFPVLELNCPGWSCWLHMSVKERDRFYKELIKWRYEDEN